MTRYAAPAYLARFKCLGAECEDTCCKGWGMQVDAPTLERYKKEAPYLLETVNTELTPMLMKRDAKTDYCVKFENGLCGIQSKHGEDFLGDACNFYPRSARRLGNEVSLSGTLSCPEIVRLSLLGCDPFTQESTEVARLPQDLNNYLPEKVTAEQGFAIHQAFLDAALAENSAPEHNFMRIFTAAESLNRINITSWPGAVPFYLQHADVSMPQPEPRATDPAFLLQALCGLVAAAKYAHHTRLMQTIRDIENALHISIRWDTLQFAALPDCAHALETLNASWRNTWHTRFDPLLRRYLAMQVSLALFPFAGFGPTLPERAAVIGIRLATVKLALMSICGATNGKPAESEVIRVVQSISRFLDHLATADLSMKIYGETGWLKGPRLRALLS